MYHELHPPIIARYVRFRPLTWFVHITMRAELYGCLLGIVEFFTCYFINYLFNEVSIAVPERGSYQECRCGEIKKGL